MSTESVNVAQNVPDSEEEGGGVAKSSEKAISSVLMRAQVRQARSERDRWAAEAAALSEANAALREELARVREAQREMELSEGMESSGTVVMAAASSSPPGLSSSRSPRSLRPALEMEAASLRLRVDQLRFERDAYRAQVQALRDEGEQVRRGAVSAEPGDSASAYVTVDEARSPQTVAEDGAVLPAVAAFVQVGDAVLPAELRLLPAPSDTSPPVLQCRWYRQDDAESTLAWSLPSGAHMAHWHVRPAECEDVQPLLQRRLLSVLEWRAADETAEGVSAARLLGRTDALRALHRAGVALAERAAAAAAATASSSPRRAASASGSASSGEQETVEHSEEEQPDADDLYDGRELEFAGFGDFMTRMIFPSRRKSADRARPSQKKPARGETVAGEGERPLTAAANALSTVPERAASTPPPPPPLMLSSLVLSAAHAARLRAALPRRYHTAPWQLLYSTATSGASLQTLYAKVAHHSPTVLAIRDTRGDVFGAFVTEPWHASARGYYGGGMSFVFASHRDRDDVQVWRWSHRNTYFQYSDAKFLALGGGSHYAIRIDDELLHGTTGACDTFDSPPLVPSEGRALGPAGRVHFQCVVLEAWALVGAGEQAGQ